MNLLQNIQSLHLQGTLAYYLNADFAVYIDMTSYVFSRNILIPYAPYQFIWKSHNVINSGKSDITLNLHFDFI